MKPPSHPHSVAALLLFVAASAACVPTQDDPKPRPDGGLEPTDASQTDGADTSGDSGLVDPIDAGFLDSALPDALPVLDEDGDGIPDLEDPAPTQFNPQLYSDSFEVITGDWIFSSVTMEIDAPRSLLRVSAVEPYEREGWIGPRPAWADYFVRSLIRANDVGSSASSQSGHAGVIARVSQVTPSRYVTCGFDLKRNRVVLAEHEGTSRRTLAEAPTTVGANTWVLVNFTVRRAAYRCKIGEVEVEGSSDVFFAGSIGFRTYDSTFDADWIEVYEVY